MLSHLNFQLCKTLDIYISSQNIFDNFAVFMKQKPDFLEQNCVSLFDF